MQDPQKMLGTLRSIVKLYEQCAQPLRSEFSLTQTEYDIICFLHNNPDLDTASDIVELRLLPKANVSQAVDALCSRGLVSRRQDAADRRRVRLSLSDAAQEIAAGINTARDRFLAQLFSGFSQAELAEYCRLNGRIGENAAAQLKWTK